MILMIKPQISVHSLSSSIDEHLIRYNASYIRCNNVALYDLGGGVHGSLPSPEPYWPCRCSRLTLKYNKKMS